MPTTPARSSDVPTGKMNSRDQTRLIRTILNTRSCNSYDTTSLLQYFGEMMMMMDKIHDTEKKDTTEDLDFLQLALDNLKLGYRQLLLDLPLDDSDEMLNKMFQSRTEDIEYVLNKYKNIIVDDE